MKWQSAFLFFLLFPLLAIAQINWTKHSISTTLTTAKKHAVVDLDKDGDYDIVVTLNPEGSGSEDPTKVNVTTFINDGSQNFTQVDVDFNLYGARGLAVGDLNGDGYPDIVAGNTHADPIAWYENDQTPADGGWVKHVIGTQARSNYSIKVADLDGDGDMDIIDGVGDDVNGGTAITDSVRWLRNDGGNPPTFSPQLIAVYPTPDGIFVDDFDQDGDLDVAACAWVSLTGVNTNDDVRWWSQSAGSFTQQQIIQTSYGGNALYTGDLDKDGDPDLVGAGWKVQTVDWWANSGNGNFNTRTIIKSNYNHARKVFVVDVDGDADLDIIACADNLNTISWFENDGQANFTEHVVTNTFTYAYFATGYDMDGDGDIDIIGTAQDANELAWWENDQEDKKFIAAGDQPPTSFWNGKVVIDFVSGDAGNVSVFYNHNQNENRNNLDAGIDHIAVSGFYTIVTDKPTYQCDITFSYSGISEWSDINNESALVICAWDKNTQKWYKVGTSQTVDAVNNTILVTGLTSELQKYSRFTLGSTTPDNPLPVQLVSFRARVEDNGVVLTWKTASEVNNQGFDVYRRSDLEQDFTLLASYTTHPELQGAGNSTTGKTYRFRDSHLLPGMTYFYKLVDVDIWGRRHEHPPLMVTFTPKNLVRIRGIGIPQTLQLGQNYPNPFNSSTTIEFGIPYDSQNPTVPVHLVIFNLLGQPVKTLFQGELSPGYYQMNWDGLTQNGSAAPSGNYIYFLQAGKLHRARQLMLLR